MSKTYDDTEVDMLRRIGDNLVDIINLLGSMEEKLTEISTELRIANRQTRRRQMTSNDNVDTRDR